jgi:hypothetical protein
VDWNLTNEYNGANLLLLHHAYDHAPNALVPLLSTMVGDINDDERRPAGWDKQEGGGSCPPAMAAILLLVVVIDDDGVGADNQCPLPNAPDGRPTDDVATVIVGFPPIVCFPTRPLPILCVVVFVVAVVFVVVVLFIIVPAVVKQALPIVFPPSPPPPLLSHHCP